MYCKRRISRSTNKFGPISWRYTYSHCWTCYTYFSSTKANTRNNVYIIVYYSGALQHHTKVINKPVSYIFCIILLLVSINKMYVIYYTSSVMITFYGPCSSSRSPLLYVAYVCLFVCLCREANKRKCKQITDNDVRCKHGL